MEFLKKEEDIILFLIKFGTPSHADFYGRRPASGAFRKEIAEYVPLFLVMSVTFSFDFLDI